MRRAPPNLPGNSETVPPGAVRSVRSVQVFQKFGGGVTVDEEVLDGVAYAGSAAFGGDRDFAGEVEVSFRIDIEVADALVVLDDGDAAVLGDESYEGFPAAGNDAMNEFIELEQMVT